MKYPKCIGCGNRTALITVVANTALAVLMGTAGALGGSHALVADGFLAGADIIISLVVLASLRMGEKEADRDHPYGHGKIEFIAGSVVAVAIILAILFLFKDAVDDINSGIERRPQMIALFAALVSVFISELVCRINRCAGKELKSPALAANAVYNRFNAYTSALVAAGIIGGMAGIQYIDPAVVIIIGVVMIKMLIEFLTKAYTGLMDTGISTDVRQQIIDIVKDVKDVEKIIFIKARSMGRRFWVNVCIEVPSFMTVTQGFRVSEMVKETILFRVENIEDVQIEVKAGT